MLYCVCLFVNGDLFDVSPIIYKNHNISLLPSRFKVVTFACMPWFIGNLIDLSYLMGNFLS